MTITAWLMRSGRGTHMAISAWLMRWLLAKEWLFAGLGRFCLGLDMPIFTWVV